MMSVFKKSFAILLTSLALVSLAYLKPWHRLSPEERERARLAVIESEDRQTLNEKSKAQSDAWKTFGAMARLGRIRDPEVRRLALTRAKDTNPVLREASAEVLGYYEDPESAAQLVALLKDAEKSVRLRAAHALGYSAGAAHDAGLLSRMSAKTDLSDGERVVLCASLLQITRSPETRQEMTKKLVKMALDSDGVDAAQAAIHAITLASRDERVIEMVKKKFETSKNEEFLALAVRHLSALRDDWVRTKLVKLAKSGQSAVRLAAIQSLHIACPEDRVGILTETFRTEKDRLVLDTAIQEPQFLGSVEAKAILAQSLKAGLLNGDSEKLAQSVLARVSAEPVLDSPCVNLRTPARAAK